ncbi:MAG: hypothetical protein AAB504_03475 [Patescibacteria group bacterium]
MNFFSKTIIFLIIFLLVFNSSGFLKPGYLKPGSLKLTPQKAGAIMWSTFIQDLGKWIWEVAKEAWTWIKNNWDKVMRDVIAKRIMDYIVDQTVTWIQGGGKPKFVTNWNGFLKDAGDIAFDSVAREIRGVDICSPFGLQLKLAFMPVEKFSESISCTLDKFVKNLDNFYIDFSVGGWEGYLASLEPNNNLYGAMLLANDAAVKRMNEGKKAAENEVLSSKGYLGLKKCKMTAGEKAFGATKGGTTWKESDNYAKSSTTGSGCASPIFKGTDTEEKAKEKQENYNKCVKDWEQSESGVEARGQFDKDMGDRGLKQDTTGSYCDPKDMENTTPGSLVGDAMGSAITTDTQWAANISSWVSALVNAVINRLMEKGLSEMSKSDPDAAPDYYPPEYADMRNSGYEQEKQQMINQIKQIGAHIGQSSNISDMKQQAADYASSTLAMLLEMQTLGCSVTSAEISAAQSNADNLASDASNAESGLSEQEQLIEDIRAADPSNVYAWAQIQERFKAYIDNSTTVSVGTTSDPAQAAQDALNDEIVKNNDAASRLNTCKSAILINNGIDTTTNANVTLRLNAASSTVGISSTTEMMISNDSAFLSAFWETYSTIKSWTLTAGAGLKTVYVRFRNAVGSVSNTFSDDIELQ